MAEVDLGRPVQIAIVVRDLDAKIRAWTEVLGVAPEKILTTGTVDQAGTRYFGESTPARVKVAVFDLGRCHLELLEPIGEPSVWSDHLNRYGEGLHHVGFLVDDMTRGVESVSDLGMTVVQEAAYDNAFERGRYAYFDSQERLGALLEFNEAVAK
jgi:catechol 2,3-dioxygenase-like lactoylglutathione lyase family enzyme